jgi:hypothetical protein
MLQNTMEQPEAFEGGRIENATTKLPSGRWKCNICPAATTGTYARARTIRHHLLVKHKKVWKSEIDTAIAAPQAMWQAAVIGRYHPYRSPGDDEPCHSRRPNKEQAARERGNDSGSSGEGSKEPNREKDESTKVGRWEPVTTNPIWGKGHGKPRVVSEVRPLPGRAVTTPEEANGGAAGIGQDLATITIDGDDVGTDTSSDLEYISGWTDIGDDETNAQYHQHVEDLLDEAFASTETRWRREREEREAREARDREEANSGQTPGSMWCDPCQIIFLEPGLWLIHRGLHGNGGDFVCAWCGKICANAREFASHGSHVQPLG